ADSSLRVIRTAAAPGAAKDAPEVTLTRARATERVKTGDVPSALVLPAGIDTSFMRFDGGGVHALVLRDPSDPVGSRVVTGLLQRAVLRVSDVGSALGTSGGGDTFMPLRVDEQEVLGEKRDNPMVAFYAAGIAVMFIMFSAASAGGVLIEENESGTLERVLTSGLGMNGLLLAKWLYVSSLACVQVTVMFVWGMFVFKLPLLSHLPGFAIMTVSTAMAAAAFGLVIATVSRTRQQLSGLANLLVLSMNALGGSMFPRFLMSEQLQKFSLVGFNAWALDGYLKVFWREQPVSALLPQVAALAGFTVVFLFLARRFASRWEVA
ncbi:MAG: ABC transporter permease, partial [Candidatus Eisenbacteria bacterium]|nr:ABC transporter permease [Candidatus Eisenbacteria bacterium]